MVSGTDSVKIWVLDEQGTNRSQITLDKETKYLKSTLLDPNEPKEVEPFLELPTNFFEEFVKAIADFASENNIKTENENLLVGKFDATTKHLEDMRRIVFKDFEKSIY